MGRRGIRYTASLAHSLCSYGIRMNGINPGWVDTGMAREYNPSGDPGWIAPEEAAQAPASMTGKFINPLGN